MSGRVSGRGQVDGRMYAHELDGYECVAPQRTSEWWGHYSGPCCRPKPNASGIDAVAALEAK